MPRAPSPPRSLVARLHWPQVAALAVVVAGTVTALVFVPTSTWAAIPWESILAGVAAVGGAGASALLGPLVRRSSDTGDSPRD